MELLHVEPTRPKWEELASIHGIELDSITLQDKVDWMASIEMFGKFEIEAGESPREAVVRLIHKLRLTGRETVSI